jgi:monoamine oxidase
VSGSNSSVDVVIIGAGSAGLAAARAARGRGHTFALLEASHRIGGRALTEEIGPGVPFDLGCHWMHSASLNPMVGFADERGFTYNNTGFPRRVHTGERWTTEDEDRDRLAFDERSYRAVREAAGSGRDVTFAEVTDREHRWTRVYDYWISAHQSVDADEASVIDACRYNDTDENWPLKEGYGALIARLGEGVAVSLNTRVERVGWGGAAVRATTPKGTIEGKAAIIAVSTGVLAAGDIEFDPPLPEWKRTAIEALPLGGANRIGILFDRDVFGCEHTGVTVEAPTPEPINFQVRPFGFDYAAGYVGGRFAAWIEKRGPDAMVEHAMEALKTVFGADITKHVVATRTSAWTGDPFIRGAYSAARLGHAHCRAELARPVDDRLFFAGEATSTEFFATCHGAWLSGVAAVDRVSAALA